MRETLWRVRPSLAICGHVHEGRGAERILWDLDCPNVKFKERATGYWTDPSLGVGSRKQCHLDLSAKSLAPLNGTGSWVDASNGINFDGPVETYENDLSVRKPKQSLAWTSATSKSSASIFSSEGDESPTLDNKLPPPQDLENASKAMSSVVGDSAYYPSKSGVCPVENRSYPSLETATHSATRGQGGSPPSGRCDLEALAERRSRKETCVVNASIMASSWPYKVKGNRKYNKPIMVDVDLPAWQDSD